MPDQDPPKDPVYAWAIEQPGREPIYEYGTDPSNPQLAASGVEGWVEAVLFAQQADRPFELIPAPADRIEFHSATRPDPNPDAGLQAAADNLDAVAAEVNAATDLTPTPGERADMAARDAAVQDQHPDNVVEFSAPEPGLMSGSDAMAQLAKEFEAAANEIPVSEWDAVAADVYARAAAEAAMAEPPQLEAVPDDPAADAAAEVAALEAAGHPATLPPADVARQLDADQIAEAAAAAALDPGVHPAARVAADLLADPDPDPEVTSTPLSSLIGETPTVPRGHPDGVPDVPAPKDPGDGPPDPSPPTGGTPAPAPNPPGPRPAAPSVASIGDPGPAPTPPPDHAPSVPVPPPPAGWMPEFPSPVAGMTWSQYARQEMAKASHPDYKPAPPPPSKPTTPVPGLVRMVPNNAVTRAVTSSFPHPVQASVDAPTKGERVRVRKGTGPAPGVTLRPPGPGRPPR